MQGSGARNLRHEQARTAAEGVRREDFEQRLRSGTAQVRAWHRTENVQNSRGGVTHRSCQNFAPTETLSPSFFFFFFSLCLVSCSSGAPKSFCALLFAASRKKSLMEIAPKEEKLAMRNAQKVLSLRRARRLMAYPSRWCVLIASSACAKAQQRRVSSRYASCQSC